MDGDARMNTPSARAEIITRRTYNRPLDKKGKKFESWEQTVDRVIGHQQWLWKRAKGSLLSKLENAELGELRTLMLERKLSVSGRTLWLGGTEVARTREASQFNCSFLRVETVYDIVDTLWLLLQGCGVGFSPVVGTLNGFAKPIKDISVINSTRTEKGGVEHNTETFKDGVWTLKVGDSAESWAKIMGKLLAGKHSATKLVFDFSEIRPAGVRLKGYGWISSGDAALSKALLAISAILNKRAGSLLSRMDILDVVNWLGTILSSRRSAQIALFCIDEPEWQEFSIAKKNWWETGNEQRVQSNNSLGFNKKPMREELEHIFDLMMDSGGSEPAFINKETARQRAPWFYGCNPCVEILLGNKSFCNLTEIDLAKFRGDSSGLLRALYIGARANYRQTCVNLRDGVLQEAWHLNNEFLRLCGVGLTGIAQRDDLGAHDLQMLQREATSAAYSMADELGLQRPKNVTCVKPSGTLSKIMDTTEGIHKPLGKYIFNNVNFGKHDMLLPILREAGYNVFDNPADTEGVLVTFPVSWDNVEFDKVDGVEVNLESALTQLERYKKYQVNWTQQNTSVTISYDPSEVPDIISWLLNNWEYYVGVSFLYRTDPTKTAEDLGYLYLPQEVVTKEAFDEYSAKLKPIDLSDNGELDALIDEACSTGACPIR
jgi:ribonucleoside-triphosphate reductase